jgi:hypothetical protein
VVWPVALLAAVIAALMVPAVVLYRRRERAAGLSPAAAPATPARDDGRQQWSTI